MDSCNSDEDISLQHMNRVCLGAADGDSACHAGEIGIDDALVMETKEEIFEMNNGCICCTVRGDLIRILNKLLTRRKKFDAIMIETTGLANPAPVIQTFFVDDDLKDACLLDAVLTVVDAKHVMQHLDEEKPEDVVNEAVQQVAFADKILLNKIDLVSEEDKQAVIRRIRVSTSCC
jgi:G3E family GTPase